MDRTEPPSHRRAPARRRSALATVLCAAIAVLAATPAVASVLDRGALASPDGVAIRRGPLAVEPLDERRVAAAPLTAPTSAPSTTPPSAAPATVPATTTTSVPAPPPTSLAPVRTSVDFGGGLLAEVLAPAGEGPHPTLVYVHGGGWVSGDHLELPVQFGLADLVEQGWAVASVGYRLADRSLGIDAADQVGEVSRVLAWVRSDGDRLGLGGRVVALGHSAGGHLLTLASATMDPALAPDVVIGVAGVYDFAADIRSSPLLAEVLPDALGCAPDECPEGWIDALTPGTHAADSHPATILVHGDADPVVPVRTAIDHAALLTDRGAAAELVLVEGGDHLDGLGVSVRAVLARVLA